MKVETYDYDEGYGNGVQKIKREGLTVDEIICKLAKLSEQGYGDRIVFDIGWEPIEEITIEEHCCFEVIVPRIY